MRIEKMDMGWDAELDEFIVITRNHAGKLRIKNTNSLTAAGMLGGGAMGGILDQADEEDALRKALQ